MLNKNSIKTKEHFQKELNDRFPFNKVEILEYEKASGPITYKCLDCGTIYKKSRANHLYENKTLCSKCYTGKTSKIRENFLQNLKDNHFELLDNPNKALTQKFHIRCLKCGKEYDYKIQQNKDSFSCKFCGKNGYPISQEEFEKRFDTNEFKVIKYKNIGSSVTLQHKCGYVFSKKGHDFILNQSCPKCKPNRSKGEQKIYQWLTNNNILFEEQKKFKELGQLSYDFFLPMYNLLIEYNGEQHYKPINYFGGEEKFKIQQEHDNLKIKFAEKNDINLLVIPYTDFLNIERILEGSTTIRKE